MLSRTQWIGLSLSLISLVLLVPGVLWPILTIKMETLVDANITRFTAENLNKTRSIFGTAKDLWESGNAFVAFLILFFSVFVPLVKSSLFFLALGKEQWRPRLQKVLSVVGKWSMADVFVVGIFICYLSTVDQVQQSVHRINAFGMQIPVKLASTMSSELGTGFYFFLGYCLVSVFATHFLSKTLHPSQGSQKH